MRLALLVLLAGCFAAFANTPASGESSMEQALSYYRDSGGARICDPTQDRFGSWADISELEHSLYTPYGDIGAERVLYVLSAPWCPFCKVAVREGSEFLRGIELRLVIGDLSNAADISRYYKILTEGTSAVPEMFLGKPPPLGDVSSEKVKLTVDALLLNAHVLQMRYTALHSYFQSIGEQRAGPFGFPANIILSQAGNEPVAALVLGQPDLNIVRNFPAIRIGGEPADSRSFVRNPKVPSKIPRDVYTWPYGARIHAYPDDQAPSFCYDGPVSLFVLGALETESGLWAYVEALSIDRVAVQGSTYIVNGYARVDD